ncbi:hypothetical protein ASE63_07980 [Bosea sp. Root381]|uniref:MerR family transcriptional regulator n=1 Tax=Bosea sp. Root381 TaxID=1736524 RepID=UPI0006FA4693|nr:MerR family transcriptional regulator [Bosea sp. Root381]KRE02288.1 hypothetical protein ASE63_07980 [Bosea sp. Root381]
MNSNTSKAYGISEIAAEFSVTLRTLRFYEQRGLLAPARTEARDRLYSDADREQLQRILTWTRQGFTLTEIKAALQAGCFTPLQMAEQLDALRQRRVETDLAIAELEGLIGTDRVAA